MNKRSIYRGFFAALLAVACFNTAPAVAEGSGIIWQSTNHDNALNTVAFSPDGRLLACAGHDGKLFIRSVRRGEEIHALTIVDILDSEQHKASLESATVYIHNGGTPGPDAESHRFSYGFYGAAFSGDARYLASAFSEKLRDDYGNVVHVRSWLVLWEFARGSYSLVKLYDQPNSSLCTPFGRLYFESDGTTLVCSGDSGDFLFVDVTRAVLVRRSAMQREAFSPMCSAADGSTLAGGDSENTITILHTASMRPIQSLQAHNKRISALAFAPDARRLVSAGYDDNVFVWDVANGVLLHRIADAGRAIRDVCFSPDGRFFVTAGFDRVIRVYDAHSAALSRAIGGVNARINTLDISPDGRFLAAGTMEGGVYMLAFPASAAAYQRDTDGRSGEPGDEAGFTLSPNPTGGIADIRFALGETANVKLKIASELGTLLALVHSGELGPGNHAFRFDGSLLPSGMYYAELYINEQKFVKKLLLIH